MNNENYSMQDAARMCGIGTLKLFALLRDKRILTKDNLPYMEYREKGYLDIHISKWVHDTMGEMARSKTVVTPSGIEFINELIQRQINRDPNEYKKCN